MSFFCSLFAIGEAEAIVARQIVRAARPDENIGAMVYVLYAGTKIVYGQEK